MTTLKSILGTNNTEAIERNFILENFKLAIRVQEEITPCVTRKMTDDEMKKILWKLVDNRTCLWYHVIRR